jgi:hypothetical protein
MTRRALDILHTAKGVGARLNKVGAREWAGPCFRCGGRDRLGVNTAKGVWNCRCCGVVGDDIALVRHVKGRSYPEALDFLDGETAARGVAEARGRRLPPRPQDDEPATKAASALFLWARGVDPRGTVAETYLRSSRELELGDDLALHVLRWHPGVRAMLALFRNLRTDEPQAISRTFINPEGPQVRRSMIEGRSSLPEKTEDDFCGWTWESLGDVAARIFVESEDGSDG